MQRLGLLSGDRDFYMDKDFISGLKIGNWFHFEVRPKNADFRKYIFNSRNIKHGVVIGEGIWRWKMAEYRLNNNANIFKDFIRKVIQYLKKTEKKPRLNSVVPKNSFENKPLYIYTEYYNELMEVESGADIVFSYKDSSGKENSKNLISRDNFYDLKLSGLPIGDYSYKIILNDKLCQSLTRRKAAICHQFLQLLCRISFSCCCSSL